MSLILFVLVREPSVYKALKSGLDDEEQKRGLGSFISEVISPKQGLLDSNNRKALHTLYSSCLPKEEES